MQRIKKFKSSSGSPKAKAMSDAMMFEREEHPEQGNGS
jgi:hypothetical protein